MSNQRRIYTLANELLPEIKAVVFAKCSRSPLPFDEIAKDLTAEKSAEFHEKWVVGFGHQSVAEHAVISLAIENVSILATKVIEDCRLASYTEKSTRYQIFNKDRIYYPQNLMNSELAKNYKNIIELLMATYENFAKQMTVFVDKKYPKTEKQTDKLYQMVGKARVCDNIRYLLPTAALTNLGMTVNARELEHLIKKLLSHPLKELNDIGKEIKEKAILIVPTLIRFADKIPYLIETKKKLEEISRQNLKKSPRPSQAVTIIDYDKEAEDKLIAALLYPSSRLPYQQILNSVKKLKKTEKENIIDEALRRRTKFDQPLRELEHIYYTFDILMDFGAFRDIQRHRMCTQSNQEVTVVHGYDLPKELAEAGLADKFKAAMEQVVDVYQNIYQKFPKEAQYVVPLAFRKRVLITWNLRELYNFIPLRSGKKGHPSYRRIAQQCWQELNKIQPLLAKYINVDLSETSDSWAASLENKEFYYNPYAARQGGK